MNALFRRLFFGERPLGRVPNGVLISEIPFIKVYTSYVEYNVDKDNRKKGNEAEITVFSILPMPALRIFVKLLSKREHVRGLLRELRVMTRQGKTNGKLEMIVRRGNILSPTEEKIKGADGKSNKNTLRLLSGKVLLRDIIQCFLATNHVGQEGSKEQQVNAVNLKDAPAPAPVQAPSPVPPTVPTTKSLNGGPLVKD